MVGMEMKKNHSHKWVKRRKTREEMGSFLGRMLFFHTGQGGCVPMLTMGGKRWGNGKPFPSFCMVQLIVPSRVAIFCIARCCPCMAET